MWLGSGISLGRVEGLPKLIVRVLHFRQQHVTVGDANCPFRIALDHVFVVGSLSSAYRTGIDVEKPVSEWPNVDSIVGRLIGNYARFLDTARLPERLAMVRPDIVASDRCRRSRRFEPLMPTLSRFS